MNRGAKVGLRARHHPAVDHYHVQRSEIGADAFAQATFCCRRRAGGKLGSERPAAPAGSLVPGMMQASDMRSKAGIAEQIVEQQIGPMTG